MGAPLNGNDHDYVWHWAFVTDIVDHQYFSCLHVERHMRAASTGHAQTGKKLKRFPPRPLAAEGAEPTRGAPERQQKAGDQPAVLTSEYAGSSPRRESRSVLSPGHHYSHQPVPPTLLTRCHKWSRRQQSSPRKCSQGLRNTARAIPISHITHSRGLCRLVTTSKVSDRSHVVMP
jgi:hypothetical protein